MSSLGGQVPCPRHPKVMTGLRCARCATPICPACMVRTTVGMRCPTCAGVREVPTSVAAAPANLLLASAAGCGVALIVAVLWRYAPGWTFYLSLLLGFGVAEAIAKVTKNARGPILMGIAMAAITLGLVVSRTLLMQRYGYDLHDLSSHRLAPTYLRMRVVPDGLFAGLAYLIAWVRFR